MTDYKSKMCVLILLFSSMIAVQSIHTPPSSFVVATAQAQQAVQPRDGQRDFDFEIFKNGRGEFYGQELLNGRMIFVRFVISDITPTSCRFEQAFSDDGGKTWEANWIAVDTRVRDDTGHRSPAKD